MPEQTQRVATLIGSKKVYVTDVVVVETVYVLEKVIQLPRNDVSRLIKSFLGFANVVHNPYFLIDTFELYDRHPGLSFVDCYASCEANAYHNDLVTFDKKLVSQSGKHVTNL